MYYNQFFLTLFLFTPKRKREEEKEDEVAKPFPFPFPRLMVIPSVIIMTSVLMTIVVLKRQMNMDKGAVSIQAPAPHH